VFRRLASLPSLLLPLTVPGVPRVPRLFGLIALAWPGVVPVRVRWRTASMGLGLIVARMIVGEDQSSGAVLQTVGEDQGRALREQLGYGRDPRECARAVALANRFYAIDASVHADSAKEARVVTPGCQWSGEEWWGRLPCGAFSRWEVGMVAGLNPAVELHYESKRTRGNDRCVGVYRWKPPPTREVP
jgi:hypothetical protein